MWNLRTAENAQAVFAITLALCLGLFVRRNPGLSFGVCSGRAKPAGHGW